MNQPTASMSATPPHLNLRAVLIQLLMEVQQGQSLAKIQNSYLAKVAPKDKALLHELSLGVLRQWFALKQITSPLLNQPLKEKQIETALYVGLYQILFMRIADYAAISETVNAVKQLGFVHMSGLVNAILRRATREKATLQQQLQQTHGLPSWLYKRLKKDWPDQVDQLCQQLKSTAPIHLRINTRQISRAQYLQHLHQQGISAQACNDAPDGIRLTQHVHIPDLVGFTAGWFAVQDEHAQLCGQILPDLTHKVVIDACAAPGGKTAHILEKHHVKQLFAIDCDADRLSKVAENLQRLQLDCPAVQLITADAAQWQAPESVDCIILDAPCSATGVLRRHPDIRLLRQSSDIAQTVALQQQILQNMWQQLKHGGILLYITCSILKLENQQQMQHFFQQHTDAVEIKLPYTWGIAQTYGRQLLPSTDHGDGFYYCLIQKQPSP